MKAAANVAGRHILPIRDALLQCMGVNEPNGQNAVVLGRLCLHNIDKSTIEESFEMVSMRRHRWF